MSFELSKSNESSLSFVWIIIKIPIHKRTAEPINSQTLLDKKFFKINPINPEKIVTIIETINNIDLKSAFCVHPFYTNCPKVKNLVIKNIGYTDWKYINDLFLPGCPENTINLTGVSNWGADNEANRKTLVDSLLTYSFDRRSANRVTHNIWLNSTTLARLTDSEKAAIVAKGYNLISK